MFLYPKGEAGETENYVGMYLNLKNDISNIKVQCTFGIINNKEEEENVSSFTYTYYSKTGFGIPYFIKREELFSKAASLLPNNDLTIMCKVFQIHEIYLFELTFITISLF